MESEILRIEHDEHVVILRLTEKKLYQHAVPEFQETVKRLVEQGKTHYLIDLSIVELMNSSALGVLILLADGVRKNNGRMVVTGYNRLLEELFERMRLDTLFQMIKDPQAALQTIKSL